MSDRDNEKMPDVPDSTITREQARDLLEQNAAHRSTNIETAWRDLQDDVAHWNSTHPDEEPIVIEPITAAEIEAMKRER